ncbi:hypothetical protein QCA50_007138 [Cerrena zonata]|uniref:Uncharacterized protein n=1 Tax=Cerrena zonata TaxID=2478898 RepID=A0AAW0GAC5_9APHY
MLTINTRTLKSEFSLAFLQLPLRGRNQDPLNPRGIDEPVVGQLGYHSFAENSETNACLNYSNPNAYPGFGPGIIEPMHPNANYNTNTSAGNALHPQWSSTDVTGRDLGGNFARRSMDAETIQLVRRFLISVRDEEASNIQMLEQQIGYLNSLLEKSRYNHQNNDRAIQTYESMMGIGRWAYARADDVSYTVPDALVASGSVTWQPTPSHGY